MKFRYSFLKTFILFQIRLIMKGKIVMKKTRILSFLLCVCLVVNLLLVFGVSATSPESDFTFEDSTGTIIRYVGSAKDVEIPSTIRGKDVTVIGEMAFKECTSIINITIPNSVTKIGNWAFIGCSSLTGINIPVSITSIGINAYSGCSGLTSINVESGNIVYMSENDCLIEIESNSLILGCKTSIIPDYITMIRNNAFGGCNGLTSITIPENVSFIGTDAFYGCSGLTSIIIPNSVNYIGDWAFYGCSSLTSITIPDSVASIKAYTFYGCSGLTSIIIPESVTSIGDGAFYNCSGLISITIPDSVTSIGDWAFHGCSGLTSITFKSPTTLIYDSEHTVPSAIKIIGYNPSTAKDYAIKYDRTFTVYKVNPEYTTPTGLSAVYGQTLADIILPTAANGVFTWEDDLTTVVGNTGTNYFNVTFTPDDTENYNIITEIEVAVSVGKAILDITTNPSASAITYGQTLTDSILTGGIASVEGYFAWTDNSSAPAVSDSDTTLYSVTYTPDDTINYNTATTDITLTINKADPAYTTPTGLSAVYGQTLADIILPTADNGSFTWEDALTTVVGNAGTNYFNVTFTPTDTANYNIITEIQVDISVGKDTPIVTTAPSASDITDGQTLADSTLTSGIASVEGEFTWTDGSITPAVSDSGTTEYSVTFTPTDTVNYESVVLSATLNIKNYIISGQVKCYDATVETTVTLYETGTNTVAYTVSLTTVAESGEKILDFSFESVANGIYDLVVTNSRHGSYTLNGLETNEAEIILDLIIIYLLGDVNRNGSINSTDVLLVRRYIAGLEIFDASQQVLADVNKNGAVNSTDVLMIRQYIAGLRDKDYALIS